MFVYFAGIQITAIMIKVVNIFADLNCKLPIAAIVWHMAWNVVIPIVAVLNPKLATLTLQNRMRISPFKLSLIISMIQKTSIDPLSHCGQRVCAPGLRIIVLIYSWQRFFSLFALQLWTFSILHECSIWAFCIFCAGNTFRLYLPGVHNTEFYFQNFHCIFSHSPILGNEWKELFGQCQEEEHIGFTHPP